VSRISSRTIDVVDGIARVFSQESSGCARHGLRVRRRDGHAREAVLPEVEGDIAVRRRLAIPPSPGSAPRPDEHVAAVDHGPDDRAMDRAARARRLDAHGRGAVDEVDLLIGERHTPRVAATLVADIWDQLPTRSARHPL
jgi:hypothetical protein